MGLLDWFSRFESRYEKEDDKGLDIDLDKNYDDFYTLKVNKVDEGFYCPECEEVNTADNIVGNMQYPLCKKCGDKK